MKSTDNLKGRVKIGFTNFIYHSGAYMKATENEINRKKINEL